MSSHSKWATTKHKKATIDAKRGKLFARLIKNIEIAARTGGDDPIDNPAPFDAIQEAKRNSVPAGNITRTVKRGSGEEVGDADWQTIMYEGYGPSGVAFLVEYLTDNRNRAAPDMRVAFSHNNGDLADPDSVAYSFTCKGVVEAAKTDGVNEDSILIVVLEASAEEVEDMGESFEIYSESDDIVAARIALTEARMDCDSVEVQFVASMRMEVDAEGARRVFHPIDALEDSDDVQNVYTSVDLSPKVAAEFAGGED